MICTVALIAYGLQTTSLAYAPGPIDNPLKGLVPYQGAGGNRFPHSMEFNYLPLSSLVVGKNQYDWKALESLLNDIAYRGNQSIFRIFLEYPGAKTGIPKYLLDGGLKVHRYSTSDSGSADSMVETPDYNNPNLRECLLSFISALGRKYDGDPRIGFITAGLLGMWGEWHDYPKDELFAPITLQSSVMDTYQSSFKRTPILLRYPRANSDPSYASNIQRPMGYHDDSFAWATLDTGKPTTLGTS